ncbi:potassium transporter TrkG [Mycoplasmoides fastidiosum]|nr:potassium transporter TrkG [Mycoplasmoides fastidiosum]UUD37789.1 potassium transporter KtrB [Mycoplasmoides fastidiosum]
MPFSLNSGWVYENNSYVWYQNGEVFQTYTFFDSIFFASSAFSDTGLTTKVTGYIFSIPGQFIITLLIQVGGLGLIAIAILIWKYLINKTNFTASQRYLLNSERGNAKSGESHKMIGFAFVVIFILQLIIWFALSFFFYNVKPQTPENAELLELPQFNYLNADKFYGNVGLSIWAAYFHTISALNNAGFDILGPTSIYAYNGGLGNILSFFLLIALIAGGIGYPIFYDIFQWIQSKRKGYIHRITLFTKISVLSYFVIAFFGLVLILVFELPRSSNFKLFYDSIEMENIKTQTPFYNFSKLSSGDKVWNFIFVTFSSRSAGFSSVPMDYLTIESRWLMSALMFIGASPSSAGGGIRTVTLFIIIRFLYSRAVGRKYVSVFKRTIHRNLVIEALMTFILALALIFVVMILISSTTTELQSGTNVIFEAISAFGTSGLTTGVTGKSSIVGLIGLIFLMFVGQLGLSNSILLWTKKSPTQQILRYQYEDLRVS